MSKMLVSTKKTGQAQYNVYRSNSLHGNFTLNSLISVAQTEIRPFWHPCARYLSTQCPQHSPKKFGEAIKALKANSVIRRKNMSVSFTLGPIKILSFITTFFNQTSDLHINILKVFNWLHL